MHIYRTISEYRSYISQYRGRSTIGFVPTMGSLHEGHLSLVTKSKQVNEITVTSIFVNPLQFGPNEDYERYPRDEERDLSMLQRVGVDVVFIPNVREMYPRPMQTTVSVVGISEILCGRSRPGHFAGVATVVMKLLQIIEPDFAYFGKKDLQQVALTERMVSDLNIPVTIVPCDTLRESDGLAMSSRNVYLSPSERQQAPILHQALQKIETWMNQDENLTVLQLIQLIKQNIHTAPDAMIDYVEVLSYPDFQELTGSVAQARSFLVAVAVKFGSTRLIDNRVITFHKV
jgi:pantoate--beta-alanine ligase